MHWPGFEPRAGWIVTEGRMWPADSSFGVHVLTRCYTVCHKHSLECTVALQLDRNGVFRKVALWYHPKSNFLKSRTSMVMSSNENYLHPNVRLFPKTNYIRNYILWCSLLDRKTKKRYLQNRLRHLIKNTQTAMRKDIICSGQEYDISSDKS